VILLSTPIVKPKSVRATGGRGRESLAEFIVSNIGSFVIISTKNGVIYEGTLIGKDHGFLILTNVIVRGSKYIAKVDKLLLNPDIIQHIHGKPIQVIEARCLEPLEGSSEDRNS